MRKQDIKLRLHNTIGTINIEGKINLTDINIPLHGYLRRVQTL